eukprot:gene5949-33525_t
MSTTSLEASAVLSTGNLLPPEGVRPEMRLQTAGHSDNQFTCWKLGPATLTYNSQLISEAEVSFSEVTNNIQLESANSELIDSVDRLLQLMASLPSAKTLLKAHGKATAELDELNASIQRHVVPPAGHPSHRSATLSLSSKGKAFLVAKMKLSEIEAALARHTSAAISGIDDSYSAASSMISATPSSAFPCGLLGLGLYGHTSFAGHTGAGPSTFESVDMMSSASVKETLPPSPVGSVSSISSASMQQTVPASPVGSVGRMSSASMRHAVPPSPVGSVGRISSASMQQTVPPSPVGSVGRMSSASMGHAVPASPVAPKVSSASVVSRHSLNSVTRIPSHKEVNTCASVAGDISHANGSVPASPLASLPGLPPGMGYHQTAPPSGMPTWAHARAHGSVPSRKEVNSSILDVFSKQACGRASLTADTSQSLLSHVIAPTALASVAGSISNANGSVLTSLASATSMSNEFAVPPSPGYSPALLSGSMANLSSSARSSASAAAIHARDVANSAPPAQRTLSQKLLRSLFKTFSSSSKRLSSRHSPTPSVTSVNSAVSHSTKALSIFSLKSGRPSAYPPTPSIISSEAYSVVSSAQAFKPLLRTAENELSAAQEAVRRHSLPPAGHPGHMMAVRERKARVVAEQRAGQKLEAVQAEVAAAKAEEEASLLQSPPPSMAPSAAPSVAFTFCAGSIDFSFAGDAVTDMVDDEEQAELAHVAEELALAELAAQEHVRGLLAKAARDRVAAELAAQAQIETASRQADAVLAAAYKLADAKTQEITRRAAGRAVEDKSAHQQQVAAEQLARVEAEWQAAAEEVAREEAVAKEKERGAAEKQAREEAEEKAAAEKVAREEAKEKVAAAEKVQVRIKGEGVQWEAAAAQDALTWRKQGSAEARSEVMVQEVSSSAEARSEVMVQEVSSSAEARSEVMVQEVSSSAEARSEVMVQEVSSSAEARSEVMVQEVSSSAEARSEVMVQEVSSSAEARSEVMVQEVSSSAEARSEVMVQEVSSSARS